MKICSTLFAICALLAPNVFAWNDFGHMAIADIAYSRLTPTAKIETGKLLQLNPQYSRWINGVPAAERERVAFMRAAVWADAIKGDADYIDERGCSASQGYGNKYRNMGYDDRHRHRCWHFINLPFSTDHTPIESAAAPNLKTQIAAMRQTLAAKNSGREAQSYSLVWLLHLIGDAHQPLHASSRFTQSFPHGDQGGNAVVLCEQTCDQTLHAYWDRALGSTRKTTAVQRAALRYPPADPFRARILDESIWLQESADIARTFVYQSIADSTASFSPDKSYKLRTREIARQQAALAGSRLANVLNDLFDAKRH